MLVRHLFEFGGEQLFVAGDHPVYLVAGGQRRPITAAPITDPQVESLVVEIAPPDLAAATRQQGELSFPYASPSGPVTVRWKREGKMLTLSVERAATPAAQGSVDAAFAAAGFDDAPPARAAPAPAPAPARAPAPAPAPAAATTRPAVQTGPAALDPLLRTLVEKGGSDLYICTGKPPLLRKDGDLMPFPNAERLTPAKSAELLSSITPAHLWEKFQETHDVDFAYEIVGAARFRANLFVDRFGIAGVFRQIPAKLRSAEELGLSPAVIQLCTLNKGLVLVTGPTGSGKSTTLAAMIDYINRNRSAHLITIEDPIEFVHEDKRCVINQREVHTHTQGFKHALRAALREDPDIVLVGELRDLETIAIAIETAETGHLVFGTLHTNTAASTVDRIIDQFPPDQQAQIRVMLSESLKGVLSQTLCKKKGGGRAAALEVLIVTTSVSNLIRESKTFQIPSIMQTGKGVGMVTLGNALHDLVRAGTVEATEAMAKAIDRPELKGLLARSNIFVD